MKTKIASEIGLLLILTPLLQSAWLLAGDAAVANPPPARTLAQKQSLFDRVAELNKVQEPELDSAKMGAEFDELVRILRGNLRGAQSPKEKIEVLNKSILGDREVAYLSNKYWRDSTLAASLLRRKGNCLSTSTLYVLAGEALGLPIKMVLVPGHAFVRWDDGKEQINIETTNRGCCIPNTEYLSRWSQPDALDIEQLGWGRSISGDAVFAELLLMAAYHRVGENRLEDALKLMEQAEKLVPARCDHRLGKLQLVANITGRRTEAREKVWEMINDQKQNPLPPSVESRALMFLAGDAAGDGNHELERRFLIAAFKRAPKSDQLNVLSQLAFCMRALKDYRGALRYMELAAAIDPTDGTLYNLAILQKCDGKLKDALATIRQARKMNSESWNLQILEAGYLVLDGQTEAGQRLFESLEKPRGDVDFWEIMQAWYFAATKQHDKFYVQLERALSITRSTNILEWIDQDPDLDIYREQEKFKALVEKHRLRLTGAKAETKK